MLTKCSTILRQRFHFKMKNHNTITRVYKFHKLDSLICIFRDIIVFVPTVYYEECEIWYIGSPTFNSNIKMVHNIVRYKNKGLNRLKTSRVFFILNYIDFRLIYKHSLKKPLYRFKIKNIKKGGYTSVSKMQNKPLFSPVVEFKYQNGTQHSPVLK